MCSVNLIVYRTELKAKLSFLYAYQFKYATGYTGFIFNVKVYQMQKTCMFTRVIFKESLVLMCLASVFNTSRAEK